MLRITPMESDRGTVTLRVEGRVVGRWAEALKGTCERILAGGATLTLDLSGVSFVERGAVELFRDLRERQVSLLNCSIFVAEQLKAREWAMMIETRRRQEAGPDSLLVDRLRDGESAALEMLMERYGPRVYRLAHGITRNEADAEEVVQDVFLAVFRKIRTFEGRAALGSWLYRVTTNAALLKRRSRRADREVSLDSQLPSFLADGHREGDPAYLNADWSQTPEAEMLSQETRNILSRVIDGLPDQYRAVLVLRDIEGLTNEKVAEAVGESVAAVKSRLHRARMVLREELTRHLGPRRRARVPENRLPGNPGDGLNTS